MKETDKAWLAGLYEGEGSCPNGGSCQYIYIKMTDKDIIERVKDLFGSGSIYHIKMEQYKDQYKWQIGSRKDVERFISLTIDYLGQRRTKRFLEVLDHYSKRDKNKKVWKGDLKEEKTINHGTNAGYQRHIYLQIEPCDDCRKANKEHTKSQKETQYVT